MDTEDFPFEDNLFDAVIALELIEHLYDPDHFLEEVYRVLKPSGYFILSTPNLASIHNRIALLFGFQPFSMNPSHRFRIGHITDTFRLHKYNPDVGVKREFDHIRLFTYRALKDLLKRYGFKVIKSYGAKAETEVLKTWIAKILNIIENFICIFPSLSYDMIFIAKK